LYGKRSIGYTFTPCQVDCAFSDFAWV